jgi:hypothetical protein
MNDTETLVQFGGAVKALGGGRFIAPLVTFSDASRPDLAKDFFTKSCDFWQDFPARVPLLYAHGLDKTVKSARLGDGRATLELKDDGVWMEGQLALADAYQAHIYSLIEAGKMGTSSGSASHLVSRKSVGDAFEVTSWPIVEASLTPQPCEPQNFGRVRPLKSLELLSLKDVMSTGDGYAPANPRPTGTTAGECPHCHRYLPPGTTECPQCGFNLTHHDHDPASNGVPPAGKTFDAQLTEALAAVESCKDRAQDIHLLRSAKSGRTLSAANRQKLQSMHESLGELLLMTEPKPAPDDIAALEADMAAAEAQRTLQLLGL